MIISIVLPVYNEEQILERNARQVLVFCRENLRGDWQIIISDNNSRDKTREIAERLASEHKEIKYYFTKNQGKGYGVVEAWENFPADIYVFMDADLATDIRALPNLIEAVESGECDIAMGSRFATGSRVKKPFSRKIFSYGLKLVLKIFLGIKTKDAPCGFKVINNKVMREIAPKIKNRGWFFDTEMVYWAEKNNMIVKELPVMWAEQHVNNRKSRVGVLKVMLEYLKNIREIRRRQ